MSVAHECYVVMVEVLKIFSDINLIINSYERDKKNIIIGKWRTIGFEMLCICLIMMGLMMWKNYLKLSYSDINLIINSYERDKKHIIVIQRFDEIFLFVCDKC